jgi:pyruvate/2-oxoglutarate dehydrogenase complex dihydrolipoamide dehydrogenase (E3) component
LTGHGVTAIDPIHRHVCGKALNGKEFEASYDRLLIATGASPIMPDVPGFNRPEVMAIKSLEDGRKIKQFLDERPVTKAVIIGMGYIALEMCESLTARDVAVDMVKPNPVFLPWLEPSMAQVVKTEVESNGIGVHAGHAIKRIEKSDGGLKVVCSDLVLDADMVLVGMGVRPNSQLAEDAGLSLSLQKSIAVDRQLRTSNEKIYAAGDCADAYHVVTREKTWIPLALRANRAGWAAADNVCGKHKSLDGVAGTSVFKVFNLEVARTGLNSAEAQKFGFDPVEMVIKSRSRAHGHPGSSTIWVNMIADRSSGRLLGTQSVGRDGVAHRINGPAVALHNQMTVEQFSQTDLAYSPPFGPTWDPMLTAANQLLKKI